MAGALVKAIQKRMATKAVKPMAKEGGSKVMKVLKTAIKKRVR